MHMHVDQAGKGEAAGELGRRGGGDRRNRGDRTVRDRNRPRRVAALPRIDYGDAGDLEVIPRSATRGGRPLQSEPGEHVHENANHEYEQTFIILNMSIY